MLLKEANFILNYCPTISAAQSPFPLELITILARPFITFL